MIKLSHKSVRNLLGKIKDIVKGNKTISAASLIAQLNPILRGWANYHRHIVAKETFNYVDYRVWKLLWQWCRRRHQNRRKRWIKAKYFKTVGKRHWTFTGIQADGYFARLIYTSDTPIKRHIKLKAEANPYDLAFEEYFEKRLERTWRDSM